MQVVTVRSIASARLVVRHFGLDSYFEAVHGPEPSDPAMGKADLLRAAMAGIRTDGAVMIGDRADDIKAAREAGVRAVAVGWGYGTHEEIQAAGPDHFAATVTELVDWIARADSSGRSTVAVASAP